MKYEIELIGWYMSGETDKRVCESRDTALRIFKQEYNRAKEWRDFRLVKGYLSKIYKDGTRNLIYQFDLMYYEGIRKV